MFIASISLWRKYHPAHKTVLYLDDISYDLFYKLDILHLWHEVRPLVYPEKIKREIFWSGSKTKIISETKVPLLVIDHDFLIFRNIDEYLQDNVLCTYDELTTNWYPTIDDHWGKKLSDKIPHLVNRASNVSLFYLPDPVFANKYGTQTLKNHAEFSAMDTEGMTANHMIYSEQFMLRQWIHRDNIPYKTLCKNIWDCAKLFYTDKEWENGYWDIPEAKKSYKHYGAEKRHVLDNKLGYRYDETMGFLLRCVNASRFIDPKYVEFKLKVIENR